MTETRERFREQLGSLMNSVFADSYTDHDDMLEAHRLAMQAAAEAVYTQALRDVLDELGADTPSGYLVERLADDKGIALGEE